MRVVILTREERGIASRYLARPPELPGVEVLGAVLDEGGVASSGAHLRAKARKLARVGPTAAPVGLALRRLYRRAASAGAPPLDEVAPQVLRVSNPNGDDARSALGRLAPDLLVTLSSRLLTAATFSLPPNGTVNVHHGAVPRFRGGPPVFWELAEGEDTVGFTIHRIDAGVDTGPVLAEGEVPIEFRPSLAATLEATLPALHEASFAALDSTLVALAEGTAIERAQEPDRSRHGTTPTLRDLIRVERRLRSRSRT